MGSLALKSGNKTTSGKNLGHISGLRDTDYFIFADFENGEYTKRVGGQKQSVGLLDIFDFSESSKVLVTEPKTMSRTGVISTITSQQPRFWKSSEGAYGLLLEGGVQNLFLNSNTPTTQNITIAAGSRITSSVIGSGSITVTADGINPITVTELTPSYLANVSGKTITVTVSGSLEHVQILRGSSGSTSVCSPIKTVSSYRDNGYDVMNLNSSLLPAINNGNDLTILVKTSLIKPISASIVPTNASAGGLFKLESNQDTVSLGLNTRNDINSKNYGGRLQSYNKVDAVIANSISQNSTELQENVYLIAYRVNATSLSSAEKGQALLKTVSGRGIGTITKLGTLSESITNLGTGAENFIINKLAIYNKPISDAELLAISKSWM